MSSNPCDSPERPQSSASVAKIAPLLHVTICSKEITAKSAQNETGIASLSNHKVWHAKVILFISRASARPTPIAAA